QLPIQWQRPSLLTTRVLRCSLVCCSVTRNQRRQNQQEVAREAAGYCDSKVVATRELGTARVEGRQEQEDPGNGEDTVRRESRHSSQLYLPVCVHSVPDCMDLSS